MRVNRLGKPSIIVTAAFAATQLSNFGNPSVSINGPIGGFVENLVIGKRDPIFCIRNLVREELIQFTGFDFNEGSWKLPVGLILLIGSGLMKRFVGKYVNPSLKKVPMIGKMVTF